MSIEIIKTIKRIEILQKFDMLIKKQEINEKEKSKEFVSGYCEAIKDVINIIKEVL